MRQRVAGTGQDVQQPVGDLLPPALADEQYVVKAPKGLPGDLPVRVNYRREELHDGLFAPCRCRS